MSKLQNILLIKNIHNAEEYKVKDYKPYYFLQIPTHSPETTNYSTNLKKFLCIFPDLYFFVHTHIYTYKNMLLFSLPLYNNTESYITMDCS